MPPRLFYFCHSHQRPTGGQKHTYRHVDILTAHGYDAYAFHEEEGFRLTWFDNETRVIGPAGYARLYDSARDYMIVPEDLDRPSEAWGGRVVVFDKNAFYGFRAQGVGRGTAYRCLSPSTVALLAVSEHNAGMLRFAYPALPVHCVSSEIRTDIFAFRPLAGKKPLIVSATKGADELVALYHLIRARGVAGHNHSQRFKWVLLKDRTEGETAAILQDALLYVHLNGIEGLPRLPREAMACGCLVVAHDAGPLRECVAPRCLFRSGDLVPMAQFLEDVMRSYPHGLDMWDDLVQEGVSNASRYTLQRQEESVLRAWESILAGAR